MHRARRTGRPIADFGDAVAPRPIRRIRSARFRPKRRAVYTASSPVARVLAEVRRIRGARSAWRFLRWLVHGVRWRWREDGSRHATPHLAEPPLGAEIATVGRRAAAVFRTAAIAARPDRDVDVVVADTRRDAPRSGAPAVILAESPQQFSVPAFDPRRWNPVGWVRNVEAGAACLGPRRLLPRDARVRRQAVPDRSPALRRCHHLEDVAAYHRDPIERAGRLARLAATGLPVRLADGGAGLDELLGPELFALMTTDIRGADMAERERISIRMRRAALRDHALDSRARTVCAAAMDDPPHLPLVSILLATRRPANLAWALANVARQNYPRLELVLALHGCGFAAVPAIDSLPFPARVLRLDEAVVFGAVLNAAADAARGVLLTKMDDDDLYGADHVWDLVLAHRYAGAQLVGKYAETIYLAHSDRTVQRTFGPRGDRRILGDGGGQQLADRAQRPRRRRWLPPRRVRRGQRPRRRRAPRRRHRIPDPRRRLRGGPTVRDAHLEAGGCVLPATCKRRPPRLPARLRRHRSQRPVAARSSP